MFCTKAFLVTLLFVLYSQCSVADRLNYLTDEDFAKARLLPSAAINGTTFTPPQYRRDYTVSNEPDYTCCLNISYKSYLLEKLSEFLYQFQSVTMR